MWRTTLFVQTVMREAVTPTLYAGAMLLHVALAQIGVWQVLPDVGARVGSTALSAAQVVGTVAFGFA